MIDDDDADLMHASKEDGWAASKMYRMMNSKDQQKWLAKLRHRRAEEIRTLKIIEQRFYERFQSS